MEDRSGRTDVPLKQQSEKEAQERTGGRGQTVREVMTPNPQTVTPNDDLQKVAKLMVESDCGALPVVENNKVSGIITDRDIVVRVIAQGKNPLQSRVSDAMSRGVQTVRDSDPLDRVMQVMSQHKVRRVPVVDDQNRVVGIVAQADLAMEARDESKVERTVEKISEKGGSSSPPRR